MSPLKKNQQIENIYEAKIHRLDCHVFCFYLINFDWQSSVDSLVKISRFLAAACLASYEQAEYILKLYVFYGKSSRNKNQYLVFSKFYERPTPKIQLNAICFIYVRINLLKENVNADNNIYLH
jgi:hypothetical protein